MLIKDLFNNMDDSRPCLYSGLINDCSIASRQEIEENLRIINGHEVEIRNKLLEVPQFSILFDNGEPYYFTQYNSERIKLPKTKYGRYYDPLEDTEAFKMIVSKVKEMAEKEFDELIQREYDGRKKLGSVHLYYGIEKRIMKEHYGLDWINNPMDLNLGLCID